jgi:hypothetical protein
MRKTAILAKNPGADQQSDELRSGSLFSAMQGGTFAAAYGVRPDGHYSCAARNFPAGREDATGEA